MIIYVHDLLKSHDRAILVVELDKLSKNGWEAVSAFSVVLHDVVTYYTLVRKKAS